MKRITVFCGSNSGKDAIFERKAFALGQTLAKRNIGLVYGGGKVGLMGAVADGALSEGGEVIGVIPRFLQEKEIAHPSLTELIWTDSMHERKAKMHDLSDGIITLPGGLGTLEELFEMLTWSQLGLHQKPVALLNTNSYYDPLIAMLRNMADHGFLKKVHQDMLLTGDHVDELLEKMENYTAPIVDKWIIRETA